jgi:hypothetical protein
MLGLLNHWKRGGSRLQQRPNFRLVKTSIGPLTTRVLCGDDLSGEIPFSGRTSRAGTLTARSLGRTIACFEQKRGIHDASSCNTKTTAMPSCSPTSTGCSPSRMPNCPSAERQAACGFELGAGEQDSTEWLNYVAGGDNAINAFRMPD